MVSVTKSEWSEVKQSQVELELKSSICPNRFTAVRYYNAAACVHYVYIINLVGHPGWLVSQHPPLLCRWYCSPERTFFLQGKSSEVLPMFLLFIFMLRQQSNSCYKAQMNNVQIIASKGLEGAGFATYVGNFQFT